jgi:hypothetical protein
LEVKNTTFDPMPFIRFIVMGPTMMVPAFVDAG